MRRSLGGLIVGALLAASPSFADPFDARLDAARANEATPEWRAYSGPFFAKLGPVLQQTMQRCFRDGQGELIEGFTLLFVIRADGSLADFMVRPDFPESACAISGMRDVRVPPPPRPDWWEFLNITLTP